MTGNWDWHVEVKEKRKIENVYREKWTRKKGKEENTKDEIFL